MQQTPPAVSILTLFIFANSFKNRAQKGNEEKSLVVIVICYQKIGSDNNIFKTARYFKAPYKSGT